jgi:hypothetical protein
MRRAAGGGGGGKEEREGTNSFQTFRLSVPMPALSCPFVLISQSQPSSSSSENFISMERAQETKLVRSLMFHPNENSSRRYISENTPPENSPPTIFHPYDSSI